MRMGGDIEDLMSQACASWDVFVIEWKLYLQVVNY